MKQLMNLLTPSYLDEFMWRERKGKTHQNAVAEILSEIAAQYPVS